MATSFINATGKNIMTRIQTIWVLSMMLVSFVTGYLWAYPVKERLVTPQSVLDYWYSDNSKQHWFSSTPEIDAEIKRRFEATWQAASRHELDSWCDTADGCLALVIVLDQLPLNMYRGQEISFSTEAQARNIARLAIAKGFDKQIAKDKLSFLFLPFMHSESLADQETSLQLFFDAGLDDNIPFAQHHHDIIAHFGRFPHRNPILGRTSTPEELAYMKSPEAFKGGLYDKK
jgi:uncharacterized protein (DUF924 family)